MYVKYLNLSDEYTEYNSEDNSIINLEKTNIFIGKNNSGKSRLMRQVLINEHNKKYYINKNIDDFFELKNNISELVEKSIPYVREQYEQTYLFKEKNSNKIYRNVSDEQKLVEFLCNLVYYEDSERLYQMAKQKKIITSPYSFNRDSKYPSNSGNSVLKSKIVQSYGKILEQIEEVIPDTIYFPSFLSLKKLDNINLEQQANYHSGMSKLYLDDYFPTIKDFKGKIKTGQEVFMDMKRQLLGLNKEREQFLKYEEFISKNFFDGKDISIFIKDDDNNIYIKEENEEPYPIYVLGDGLQTLITITYYLFKNDDKPLKVFIDEPEIHLHPGLQRLLISKLQEYKNCQFFISTHSSSFIDICDEYDNDTAIICVDKLKGKKYAYNSAYDDMNLFELIGVRPSSIILSNCTIWVEGPTDIYYIDSFLKLYSKLKTKREFILGYNYNYAFNGSINIASKIDFDNDDTATMKIKKLSKKNFVIFDSDNLTEENINFKKIKKLKTKLGSHCCVIKDLKTIENIIDPRILYDFFNENYKSKDKNVKPLILKFFESLKSKYSTSEYYKMNIAEEMAEYINNSVGEKDKDKYKKFCKKLWNSNKYNLSMYFSNKILDLSNKEQEILFDNTMSDFIAMIEQIYKFINQNN